MTLQSTECNRRPAAAKNARQKLKKVVWSSESNRVLLCSRSRWFALARMCIFGLSFGILKSSIKRGRVAEKRAPIHFAWLIIIFWLNMNGKFVVGPRRQIHFVSGYLDLIWVILLHFLGSSFIYEFIWMGIWNHLCNKTYRGMVFWSISQRLNCLYSLVSHRFSANNAGAL